MKGKGLVLVPFTIFTLLGFVVSQVQHSDAQENVIVINEVELNPEGTDLFAGEEVELYNPSNVTVDVGGWTVSSSARAGHSVKIQQGITIAPNGFLVISSDSHWLENDSELIVLKDSKGETIDSAGPLSDIYNDRSTWQRFPDGSENWIIRGASIGGSNNEKVETPKNPPEYPFEMKIVVIDVGQGSSILVISPNRNAVLIDGGEAEQADRVLAVLKEYNINGLIVVASHPHADHIGGLVEVLSSAEVEEVMDSGQAHATQTFENFLDVIEARHLPLNSVSEGWTISPDPAVRLDILNPPDPLTNTTDDKDVLLNENSVAIKLTFGAFTAIFPGDMGEINEARLVKKMADLDADVLLAGHHGSNTSSTASFLSMVSPEVVIISAGADNSYGHPHPETLERISEAGTQHVFRTDRDGTIVLTTPGYHTYTIETEKSGKTVVVPEFGAAILVASISLVILVAFFSGDRIWNLLKQA